MVRTKKLLLILILTLFAVSSVYAKKPQQKRGRQSSKKEKVATNHISRVVMGITLGESIDSAKIVIKNQHIVASDKLIQIGSKDNIYPFYAEFLGAMWNCWLFEYEGLLKSIVMSSSYNEELYKVIEQALFEKYREYLDKDEDTRFCHTYVDDFVSVTLKIKNGKIMLTYEYMPLAFMKYLDKEERRSIKVDEAKTRL